MYQPELFFLKLAVAPVMMLIISMVARKWGGFVGGVLSGLPLTSAPIVFFLAIEQGPSFAQQAAASALSGLVAVLLTYFSYVYITKVTSILVGCLSSAAVFIVCSFSLLPLFSSAWVLLINLILIGVIIWRTESREINPARRIPQSPWDIPLRVFAATALLLTITALAKILGPYWSGILAPVPVIAWPFTIFTHKHAGRNEMIAAVRGNAFSAVGIIAFYVVVRELLLKLGVNITFVLALIASVFATFLLIKALQVIGSRIYPAR